MAEKSSPGSKKKEAKDEEDLRSVVESFIAEGKQILNPKYFSFLSSDEGSSSERSRKRKAIKLECKSSSNASKNSNPNSNEKTSFEHLLDAVTVFSRYEEDCLRKKKEKTKPGELPKEFKERIKELNGSEEKFVMEKELFKSDLSENNGRLSIPPRKIGQRFLTAREEWLLNERGEEKKVPSIPVLVLDPSLREHHLVLKNWQMERTCVYNLATGWNKILRQNHFNVHDKLHLWSFRISDQLCFALVKPH